MMKHLVRAATFLAVALLGLPPASADGIHVGISPEPGDPTFQYVPSSVPASEIVMVIIDETDGIVDGVVLLTGGRSIHVGGVQSRPFALTEAYEPARVALVEE